MKYSDYKKSRNAAWQILIDCEVSELPVKPTEICQRLGIEVRMYEPENYVSGVSMIIDNKPVIFININDSNARKRFTCAHELWHIINGDVGRYELVNREPSLSDNPIEQAANVFASRLLAPACVLWGVGVKSAEEISKLCDISTQASLYRFERMKILLKRNKFLISPLERKLYIQFKEYIEKNKIL